MNIFDANPKIVEFLRESGMLVYSEKYKHRYPHCWRCKNPVVFRATPQWFISMDEVGGEASTEGLRAKALERDRERQMASRLGRRPNGEYVQGTSGLVRFAPAFVGRADPGVLLSGVR